MLFSDRILKTLGSFENADSLSFDPHKALVVQQQASLFICRHPDLLLTHNQVSAECLYPQRRVSYSGCLDAGDKNLQCARPPDILKIWTYLKGNGLCNVAKQVESEYDLAQYVKKYVLDRP